MAEIPTGYRIEQTLREEGAVASYRATDSEGRAVVLKVIKASPDWATGATSWLRRIAAVRHPGLAAIYAFGDVDGGFFIAREWVEGRPYDPLAASQPSAVATVREETVAVADAVGALHAAGLSHGDLRPSNVIRREDGSLMVVDAGVSPEVHTGVGQPPGRALYLTPEQVEGQAYTARSDVYALGTMLYLGLTGRLPFDGPDAATVSQAHASQPAPRPSGRRPEVPHELDQVVTRAMSKAPEQRYVDANQMAAALRGAPVGARKDTTAGGGGFPLWGWLALAAIVILAVVAAVLFWPSGDNVTVPEVVGLTLAEAEASLEEAGLAVGDVVSEPETDQPEGTVLAQSPEAGEETEEGSQVELTVAGAAGVEVPDVVGASESEAIARLTDAGLRLGDVERINDAGTEPGFVLAQTPEAGEQAELGAAVDLEISLGEETGQVPDVVGLSQAEASSTLQGAGFTVRLRSVEDDAAAGTVVGQEPSPGSEAAAGSEIVLDISQGPPPEEPPEVPDVVGEDFLDARDMVRDAGLRSEFEWLRGQEPFLEVIEQDPEPGTIVEAGSVVTLGVGLSEGQEPPEIPTETTGG